MNEKLRLKIFPLAVRDEIFVVDNRVMKTVPFEWVDFDTVEVDDHYAEAATIVRSTRGAKLRREKVPEPYDYSQL